MHTTEIMAAHLDVHNWQDWPLSIMNCMIKVNDRIQSSYDGLPKLETETACFHSVCVTHLSSPQLPALVWQKIHDMLECP